MIISYTRLHAIALTKPFTLFGVELASSNFWLDIKYSKMMVSQWLIPRKKRQRLAFQNNNNNKL